MYIVNGIAYADTQYEDRKVTDIKLLDDMVAIITFKSGERRLFDASYLLEMPAFKKLSDKSIFSNPVLDHGVVTWDNGSIDIAPETMYEKSYEYQK